MIVKDEVQAIKAMWQSVKGIIDEWVLVDTGSTDGTVKVAQGLGAKVIEKGDAFCEVLTTEHVAFFAQYGIEVKEGEKLFNFGKARTFSFQQATGDFILWLDADDILVGRDTLRRIIEGNLDPNQQLGLHMLYEYEFDAYRNPIVCHYRERVVPNNKSFKWVGRIHEIIVPDLETQYIRVLPEDSKVIHNAQEFNKNSALRNAKALLLDLYEQGDQPDPRTQMQLAEVLKLLGQQDKATGLYEKYMEHSGWDEERCLVATRLAKQYILKNDFHKALDWAYRAVRERPDFPIGYSTLAQCYFGMDEVEHAERFSRLTLDTPQPDTVIFTNDKEIHYIPCYILANIYLHIGRVKDALAMCIEALKYEPLNQELLRIKHTCQVMLREAEVVQAYGKATEYLRDCGEIKKALRVIEDSPNTIKDDPRIRGIKHELEGELAKRSKTWVSDKKRLKAGDAIDIQYKLLDVDLKRFDCKTILLVSNEPLLAMGLKSTGYTVKRVINFEKVHEEYDAVFFDHNLHYEPELLEEGQKFATKLVALSVPNKSTNAVIACDTNMVKKWLGNAAWNIMPLENGIIYASAINKEREAQSITFFAGGESTEPWGPFSHLDGVGGSEEATIYLTRELASLGYRVVVVNNYPHHCMVEGVEWQHYSSFDSTKELDMLVLWRSPHYLDKFNLKAKNVMLWMHDVPLDYQFTPERVAQINKIIVLSKYHRSLLPQFPDEKFFISQNGVDVRQFNQKVERDLNKIIYTSSYDRGLEHMFKIWPDVKKQFPNASLHIFYGWGTFDKLRTEEKHRKWKSWMIEQFKLDGVHEHGRIGQEELAKEFLSAGVFAYPCHFEEISCISAMKAQVGGCIPLTTDYAALAETNLFPDWQVKGNPKKDEKVMESFKGKLITALGTNVDRYQISLEARGKFNWHIVAEEWSKEIKQLCLS
jgi:glycosyltransferase involved in cell wall biosynthesis